jgi:uncharacterized membrane protein
VISILCASSAHAALNWKFVVDSAQITDLNVPTTYDSVAKGINNSGDIVGHSKNASGLYGFFFSAATNSSYNITSGLSGGMALGLNDAGVVVGSFVDINAGALDKPFVWSWGGNAAEMAGNPAAPLTYKWDTIALAINSQQKIVGSSNRRDDFNLPPPPDTQGDCYETLAVMWSSPNAAPAMVYCPADGPESPEVYGKDINDAGSVIGHDGEANNFASRMFLWKQPTQQLLAVPLPANTAQTTYTFGIAEGLTESHRVVGTVFTNTLPRAFIWNGTSTYAQDMGTFPGGSYSSARDVNEDQIVVGQAQAIRKLLPNLAGTAYDAAFIWHPHFGFRALPALSMNGLVPRSCTATAVNDRKSSSGLVQIAGHCAGSDGRNHAVRWDVIVRKQPVDFPITP